MNIEEYCDAINKDLKLTYYNGQGRWTAKIEGAEVLDSSLLATVSGDSNTPNRAINDYIEKINGKTIVFIGRNNVRAEFKVPTLTGSEVF